MTYLVKLKDGTEFLGDRSLWDRMNESPNMAKFKVVGSKTLPKGSRIFVPLASISYIVKDGQKAEREY